MIGRAGLREAPSLFTGQLGKAGATDRGIEGIFTSMQASILVRLDHGRIGAYRHARNLEVRLSRQAAVGFQALILTAEAVQEKRVPSTQYGPDSDLPLAPSIATDCLPACCLPTPAC